MMEADHGPCRKDSRDARVSRASFLTIEFLNFRLRNSEIAALTCINLEFAIICFRNPQCSKLLFLDT